MQLVEIADLKNVSVASPSLRKQGAPAFQAKLKEECFTLLFVSPSETLLRQESWKLSHPTLGEIELFLVPVERPNGTLHAYEAVFNRLQM